MSECIFCKIIKGEIPNYTIYENDFVLAFLDIHPHALGHTVVIPKKHIENLAEINEEDFKSLMAGIRQTVIILKEKLNPMGFNVGLNDGLTAGQVIAHMHWHIFPRFKDDGGGSMHSIINNKGKLEVEEIAKLFKN